MKTNNVQESTFFEKIHTIVLENLHKEQFGTAELADKLGLSRSSLHRKLKAESGYSASRIIRRIKLNKAMEMLKSTTANISEISMECGFNSISYFTKCFGEEYGYTPLKARSAAKNEPGEINLNSMGRKNRLYSFPSYASSFIGRKKEKRTIDQLLVDHRLITLVGSGGCGKTRLAYEALSKTGVSFQDGIWFVNLSPLVRGKDVTREIMNTLKISEMPGMEYSEVLKMKLREKQLLIVLDNCEHILNECRETAISLLSNSSSIQILTTSRERLNISDEEVFQVLPLSLVDSQSIQLARQAKNSEAVLFFENHARTIDSRFKIEDANAQDVTCICQEVDGIPLGIEIVASLIKFMDPVTILDRLAPRFLNLQKTVACTVERHKTLHLTIDWGYNLLTDQEKILFNRLSVFPGSFDLDAAEAICGDVRLQSNEILDLLSSLVERSMVQTLRTNGEAMRYQQLRTIRNYASENLCDKDSLKLGGMYLDYYVSMAEQAYKERLSAQSFWMQRLQVEHHNLLYALSKADTHDRKQYANMSSFLLWYFSGSNNVQFARDTIENVLHLNDLTVELRARIYSGYANIVGLFPGTQEKGIRMFEDAINLWSDLGNMDELALTLADLANSHYGLGNDSGGVQVAQKSYETAKINGNKEILLYCTIPLSQGFVNLKQFNEARSLASQIIIAGEELQNLHAQFAGHHNTADCAIMQKEFKEAEREYGKGIELCQVYGDFVYTCVDLSGVAMAVAGQGRYAKAIRLIEAVNHLAAKAEMMSPEDLPMIFWQELIDKHIRKTRERLGDTRSRQYKEEGQKMNLKEAVEYALDFDKD